jgi:transcriptional regulator with PAS, ATPase and Fis domain
MESNKYWDEYPSAVTICDTEGIIVYMNNQATATFEKWGGVQLVGKSLFDCHNPRSAEIIKNLMKNGQTNTYSITKNGIKKLIHQSPWFNDGRIAGLIEISVVLPENMPHHNRDL